MNEMVEVCKSLLRGNGQQRRRFLARELRMHGGAQEVPYRTALLHTTGDHRPDPFAPALPRRAARSLRDMPVDHHETDGLLRQVVGRLDPRRRHEAKVRLAMLAK